VADEYTCSYCGGTFQRVTEGWSDEQALAEYDERFPAFTYEDRAIVCHDCYLELMDRIDKGPLANRN
jgi:hypothetical protein